MRIYKLLTGHYVDLAAIVDVRSGAQDKPRPGSDLSFEIRYALHNDVVRFSFDWRNCLEAVQRLPAAFPGLEEKLLGRDGAEAQSAVLRIVEDDLIREWKNYTGSLAVVADPIFRFADGTAIDLSEILDVSAPALLEEDVYGFSILYKGQAERRVFSYNCYDTATADLLGLDFEAALASPHADAADRVALDVLATHVDALVDAWRKFQTDRIGGPFGLSRGFEFP
jgi:hypothetical protein